jgi:hypothetical protein
MMGRNLVEVQQKEEGQQEEGNANCRNVYGPLFGLKHHKRLALLARH